MRYRAVVSYYGKHYVGWQRQLNGPSVQEALEKAEASVAREVALRQHFLNGGQPYWNVDRLFTQGLADRIEELKKFDE